MKNYVDYVAPKKQCIKCLYYLKNCGYWDDKDLTLPNPESIHNCQDFSLDYSVLAIKENN